MTEINDIKESIQKLIETENSIEWFGPASDNSISFIEDTLGYKFPSDFHHFLSLYGGRGTQSSPISGIIDNNPEDQTCGSILGDTTYYRKEFGMNERFIVIQRDTDDNDPYCYDNQTNMIVCYQLNTRSAQTVAETFADFLRKFILSKQT